MTTTDLTITHVAYDLRQKTMLVTIAWDGVSDRRLVLPIPFETPFEDLLDATRTAMRELADEITTATLRSAL